MVTFCSFSGYAQQNVQKGVLRVKVTEAYAASLHQQTANGRQAFNMLATGSAKFNEANARFKATRMKRVFPDAGKFEAKHRKHGLHLWYEVQIDTTASVTTAREAYRSVPEFQIAEPIHHKFANDYKIGSIYSPTAARADASAVSSSPLVMNDPMLDQQWHYNNHGQTGGKIGADINLLKAWTIEAGKKEVIVSIVDGGIDGAHPDLKDNIWVNEGEIAGNGIDDDNNGFVDDVTGFSFVDWQPTIKPHPHGTHVAGTVAAVNNNGIGVSGVAGGTGNGDGVRLMNCAVHKVLLPENGLSPEVDIHGGYENAYVYAADNGAVISQNSWSYNQFDTYDQVVLDAIDYFIAEAGQDENGNQTGPMKGGIVIFSAGNNSSSGHMYPGYYDHTLAVASLTHFDTKADNSNYGDWVDIAAPGGDPLGIGVFSTYPGGQYAFMAGTSMAAPHVSGTAALLVSHFGGLGFTPDMLRQKLVGSTDFLDGDNPDYAGMLGAGRVDAFQALNGDNDYTGPAAITDLQVKSVADAALTLQWTAPHDDGSQSASYYEMRYSTSPITSDNFFTDATSYVPNQPRTGPEGATETFTLTGLQPTTTYYVAMVSYDMFRNVSLLSNVVQATTIQPEENPVFSINPSPLQFEMLPTDSVVKTVYVTNTGGADLTYTIGSNGEASVLEGADHILTFSKRSGTVLPGKSDTLLLTFKSFEKPYFIYEFFNITTNDPNNTNVSWPVQLSFTEISGKPAFSTAQVDLGKTMVGTNSEQLVTLKNTGSKPLTLLKYSIDNPNFTAYISGFYHGGYYNFFSLDGYDTTSFKVFFHPSATGKTTGVLTIHTDNPDNPIITLPLSGEGLATPTAQASVDTLSASLNTNESAASMVTLYNTGESDLTYNIVERGFDTEQKKVLVLSPDDAKVAMPFLLTPFKEFSVDLPDDLSTLTLADLTPYAAVIVMNQLPWKAYGNIDPKKLGDLLADYVDAGGKVVVNSYAYVGFGDDTGLEGRFMTENYGPFLSDSSYPSLATPQTIGEVLVPNHPLLEGVRKLIYQGALQNVKLNTGAVGIAKWSRGEWILAANSNVVGFNFVPLGSNAADEIMTGDMPQLYRNALHWLTGSSHLTVQPAQGVLAPGNSVVLDVTINSNTLKTGLYHSALGIATNDPQHAQLIIPVGLQVKGPSFSLEPGTMSLSAAIDQQATQNATLHNESAQPWSYTISVNSVQSLPAFVTDSISNQFFSTGFANYTVGRLSNERDWSDNGYGDTSWNIDTVAAFSGKQHLRFTSTGMNIARLSTPAIEGITGKFFCSTNVMIEGQGTSFSISPLSYPTNFAITTVTFAGDGTIQVTVYDAQTESFDVKQIKETIPTGYFTVTFEIDQPTSIFKVYFNQKLVFTGSAPVGTINAIEFESINESTGQNFYIDDVLISQGAYQSSLTDFLQVSPSTGTLQPDEEVTLTAKADAHGLQAGKYSATLVANIGDGTDELSVPVLFAVQPNPSPSFMSVSHDATGATLDYQSTASQFIEIRNYGGTPFDFNVDFPADAQSWLSVEPASGAVAPNSIIAVKVKYTAATLDAGDYSSTITIASNADNVQSKVIDVSLHVQQSAMWFLSAAPFIQMEIVGGNYSKVMLPFVNAGSSSLQLKVDKPNSDWLRVAVDTTLAPWGGNLVVPVTLWAVNLNAGVYTDVLHFHTNDPNRPLFDMPVQLTVIAPPSMNVPTDTLSITVKPGAQASKSFTIANAGDAQLTYVVDNNAISSPSTSHGGPDNFGHTFITSKEPGGPAFVWNDISATGVPITLGDFDSLTVSLPFAFPFYGIQRNEVKIASDGFLAFGNVGPYPTRTPSDRNLLSPTGPTDVIAAHWDDLDPRITGAIHYKKEADKFIVQYTKIAINNWGYELVPNLLNTFQIVLHADGSIAFHYLDIMNSASQLVGISSVNGMDELVVKDVWDSDFSTDSTSVIITPTVPWMNVTSSQSDAAMGGTQSEVDVDFDATNLQKGIYHTMLYITSNDANQAVTRIPVKVDVRADVVTGIVKEEAGESLTLYPVPTKDVLNVKLTKKVVQPVNLIIRNALGQIVLQQLVEPEQIANYPIYLNSLHLSSGLYILSLTGNGWTQTKSFIKE